MSAKEMFEKLGYKQFIYEDSIVYSHTCKTYDDFNETEDRYEDRISFIENDEIGKFIKTTREIYSNDYFERVDVLIIDMDTLKAINKQVEELNWFVEEKYPCHHGVDFVRADKLEIVEEVEE